MARSSAALAAPGLAATCSSARSRLRPLLAPEEEADAPRVEESGCFRRVRWLRVVLTGAPVGLLLLLPRARDRASLAEALLFGVSLPLVVFGDNSDL